MMVIPAIDLMGGRAVRLARGVIVDYGDPLDWLDRFLGAKRIHIVDLDAAMGEGRNYDMVRTLVERASEAGIVPQVGGGIRSLERIEEVLSWGAIPVVSTMAFSDPESIERGLELGPIVVAIDSYGGRVRVRGWKEELPVTVEEALRRLSSLGVESFLVTGIGADGTLSGPDRKLLHLPRAFNRLEIVYAGGVGSLKDLELLRDGGFSGAVVGRALYEGLLGEIRGMGWEI
ncbi:MAG: 1-(5-phosphoribosyl)-5-[(5-phosphoribosylamino)methylideneamino] imidazole-4-carboxamide isomerase [Candidatus Korarchaeota archaeon]|nr:1-(5-phosphoribosyl)-5-[(5-phosphoribosylamino)methylideneamino] imidazole-4-carboxamide isomerase [Candidatus Korarchaeota archaeon]